MTLTDAMLIDVGHVGLTPKVSGEVTVVMSRDPIVYHDAAGEEIRGLMRADVDPKVDFNDFLVLVKAFSTGTEGPEFDWRADLNADDRVDFADFLIFSSDFGKVAVDSPSALRAAKPGGHSGANDKARLKLKVEGKASKDRVLKVRAEVSQAAVVQGWGLTVRFDPDRVEFVEAAIPEGNMLESEGGTAPLFLVHRDGADRVTLASAVGQGQAPSGDGTLAVLIFRPKGDIEGARFEICEGILFDTEDLSNAVAIVDALEVRPALSQSIFPDPSTPPLRLDARARLIP